MYSINFFEKLELKKKFNFFHNFDNQVFYLGSTFEISILDKLPNLLILPEDFY